MHTPPDTAAGDATTVLRLASEHPLLVLAAAIVLVAAIAAAVMFRWLRRDKTKSRKALVFGLACLFLAAVTLLSIVFAMSYAALYQAVPWLADTSVTWINGGDLRFLFPIGVDFVIVFFIALDLAMAWRKAYTSLNRVVVYVLSGATLVMQVQQGTDFGSYISHAMPPIVVIALSEALGQWVAHEANIRDRGTRPDRIPLARWFVYPLSSAAVLRVMLGWGVTEYSKALRIVHDRDACWALLSTHYGGPLRARVKTPHHLRWMLSKGMDPGGAYPLVLSHVGEGLRFKPTASPAPAPAPATTHVTQILLSVNHLHDDLGPVGDHLIDWSALGGEPFGGHLAITVDGHEDEEPPAPASAADPAPAPAPAADPAPAPAPAADPAPAPAADPAPAPAPDPAPGVDNELAELITLPDDTDPKVREIAADAVTRILNNEIGMEILKNRDVFRSAMGCQTRLAGPALRAAKEALAA